MRSDLWNKRSIIWDFAITDLKIRYRNSVLGFFWTILEPLLFLLVLYIVFTNVFKSTIEHFPLYLLLGIIIWGMLVKGTQFGLNGIQSRSGVLSQIYIPVSFPGISASVTALIMFIFEMIVFGIFLVVFQFIPPYTILLFPLIILLQFVLVLGLSLPLSVLNVKIKDIQFIWGILLHAGFFLHPIFYKTEILPNELQAILQYSPMVHILNISRDLVIYGILPSTESIIFAVGMTFLIFAVGYGVFRKLSTRIMEEV